MDMSRTNKMRLEATVLTTLIIASCLQQAAFGQARDLFIEQLDKPQSQLNTGVQYWIELHRGSEVIHANNKTDFKSGDKIRFHIKPNIDGYAYIIMMSGSTGRHAQLFPRDGRHDDNKVVRGQDITMPSNAMLTFDSNPGTEKLRLMISRITIKPKALDSTDSSALIAMGPAGSRDLFPDNASVSYISQEDLNAKPPHQPVGASDHAKAPDSKRLVAAKPVRSDESGKVVTVVYRRATGVLCCDIALRHF
jgi:hypothetical protein